MEKWRKRYSETMNQIFSKSLRFSSSESLTKNHESIKMAVIRSYKEQLAPSEVKIHQLDRSIEDLFSDRQRKNRLIQKLSVIGILASTWFGFSVITSAQCPDHFLRSVVSNTFIFILTTYTLSIVGVMKGFGAFIDKLVTPMIAYKEDELLAPVKFRIGNYFTYKAPPANPNIHFLNDVQFLLPHDARVFELREVIASWLLQPPSSILLSRRVMHLHDQTLLRVCDDDRPAWQGFSNVSGKLEVDADAGRHSVKLLEDACDLELVPGRRNVVDVSSYPLRPFLVEQEGWVGERKFFTFLPVRQDALWGEVKTQVVWWMSVPAERVVRLYKKEEGDWRPVEDVEEFGRHGDEVTQVRVKVEGE